MHVVVFEVEDTRYAVDVDRVVEIVPRVMLGRLAGAADFVEGVFVHRGSPAVAISLRRRFGHPSRGPQLSDHFIVVAGRTRLVALVVDRTLGDRAVADDAITSAPADARYVKRVAIDEQGAILIHDVDALLTADEERDLDERLANASTP